MKKLIVIIVLGVFLFIPLDVEAKSHFIGIRLDTSSNPIVEKYEKPNKSDIGIKINTDYNAGFLKGKISAKSRNQKTGSFLLTTLYLSATIASKSLPMAAGTLLIPLVSIIGTFEPTPEELLQVDTFSDEFKRGFVKGYKHNVRKERVNGWVVSIAFSGVTAFVVHSVMLNL